MAPLDDPTVDARPSGGADGRLTRGTSVGRYLLLDLLGEGGMGVVYKAYDPELGRPIALKLLPTGADDGGERSERLLREAQALARLQHPNVVAVHDVGKVGTNVFIAMEFVEGQTTREWLKAQPRSHAAILELFLAAGEGLAAAHRAGMVHRDFKPDNVMIGDDGRVRVLDFGLARATHSLSGERKPGAAVDAEVPPSPAVAAGSTPTVTATARSRSRSPRPADSQGGARSSADTPPPLLATPLTRADAIVGTPRFMAPEQHLGGVVDEAADQFSFCVSLYWALYGVFPLDRFDRVLDLRVADPPPGATVPRWLRQVLLRGLSAQPSQRWPSMTALLEALRADPALARKRRLRALLAVVAAAGVGSAVVAGGLAYQARRGAAQRALISQQFGQEVEKISAIARYAALLPQHDARREMATIRTRMDGIREQMRTLGRLAAGPGHHALGRGHLALERYDEAQRELEASWATGYRTPDLAYALGLVHGRLYERALAGLRKSGNAKRDADERAAITRAHRDPALRYLKEADPRELGLDAPEYVEGLIALYEQRYDEALGLARKASARVPWLFEARTLEGDIQLVDGKLRYWKGDVDGATARFKRAGEAYRAAAEIAHSDAAARLGDCEQLIQLVDIQVDRDQSPETTARQALAACEAAAAIRPDDAAPVVEQASAWRAIATYQRDHGVNAVEANERTIRLGERALALDPTSAAAHIVISSAANDVARAQIAAGADPGASFAQALEHAQRTLDLAPAAGTYHHLSMIYRTRAEHEQVRGLDPRASFQLAIEASRKALTLEEGDFAGWNSIGLSYLFLGQWQLAHGDDATAALRQAFDALGNVVRISPKLDYGYVNQCEALRNLAEYELRHDVDPRPRLAQAIARCGEAIALDGNYVGSQWDLGAAHLDLAAWQLDHGVDPTDSVTRANAALERGLEIDHTYQLALCSLAELRIVEARWLAARRRDAQPAFARGEELLRRTLALSDGKSVDALRLLGELHRRRAEWRAAQHASVTADIKEGLALIARAQQRDGRLPQVATIEGALHLLAARAAKTPADRALAAKQASAAFERALSLDAGMAREARPLADEASRLAAP